MSECNIFGLKQSLWNIDRLTCCYYGGQRVRKACCHSAREEKISQIQLRTYECIIPLGYLQINWKFANGSSINKPFKVKCLYKTVLLGLVGCHEQFLALFSSLNQSFNNDDDWWQSFQHLNMKYLKCLNKKARGLWTKIHVYLMYMSQKWFRQNRILWEPHYTI